MLKVFTSTRKTQGERTSDFCFVPNGEFVMPGTPCDRDKGNPDGKCGCDRSFIGFDCRKGTTTAEVAEIDLTKPQLVRRLLRNAKKQGWHPFVLTKKTITLLVDGIVELAEPFDVGAVVEYRSGVVGERGRVL